MSTINLKIYLKNVYEELKSYMESLSEDERKEFVKNIHKMFEEGTADYSSRYKTAFYILKYARAYGFQFSRAYADIIADMGYPAGVSATSIGCGTGIDYWGLSYAVRDLYGGENCSLEYTGIDPQIWPFRIAESKDMTEQDTVRYNSVKLSGEGNEKECNNFGEYINIMETNADKALDDIYFFPHSIKEVCIHTAQGEQSSKRINIGDYSYGVYKYNTYQSMARFARLIKDRIADRPVYVAFTYRRHPNEFIEGAQQKETYDVGFGTFFRACLIQRGLGVEMLTPVDIDRRDGESLCVYESSDVCREDYFDYDEYHSYTGAPENENKIWVLSRDDNGNFDSIFYDTKRMECYIPRLCSTQEWGGFFSHEDGIYERPMDSVGNMCYQVFKITMDRSDESRNGKLKEKNDWLDILEETMRDFEFNIELSSSKLDIFVNQMRLYLTCNEEMVRQIIGRITGTEVDDINDLKNMLDTGKIIDHLLEKGYVELIDTDDDGTARYRTTDLGQKAGIYVKPAENNKILVKPYAQQKIVANVICGRYTDWGNII